MTLAFAGDVHFERHLAALLTRPRGALGPITRLLKTSDLTMLNLESSITGGGVALHDQHPFRTSAAALDVLAAAGVDVVSLANNHSVDYGRVGLRDTLRAVRDSPVAVVGIGRDKREAFRPYRVSVRGSTVAYFAVSSVPDQRRRSAAGPGRAGIAAMGASTPRALVDEIRRANERDDIVVVYLHWGRELQSCPTPRQRTTARALAQAGADVIVGSHSHVLLGAGWMGESYVNYGLANFVWYHNYQPESGVLRLRLRDGEVVGDSWAPALIRPYGRPRALKGRARTAALADWHQLRSCTDLAPLPAA